VFLLLPVRFGQMPTQMQIRERKSDRRFVDFSEEPAQTTVFGAEYETRSTLGMRKEQILLFSSLSVTPNMHVLQYRIRMIT
jgi:hypothetical protein